MFKAAILMFCAINCGYIHGLHVSDRLGYIKSKIQVSLNFQPQIWWSVSPQIFQYTYLGTMQFEQTMYSASSVYGFWKLWQLVLSHTQFPSLARNLYLTDSVWPFSFMTETKNTTMFTLKTKFKGNMS